MLQSTTNDVRKDMETDCADSLDPVRFVLYVLASSPGSRPSMCKIIAGIQWSLLVIIAHAYRGEPGDETISVVLTKCTSHEPHNPMHETLISTVLAMCNVACVMCFSD